MPRVVINRTKSMLLPICVFFFAFFLGLHYWQLILPNQCPTAESTFLQQSNRRHSFYQHFQYRTIGNCVNERLNLFLTIAVLSSNERLIDYLPAILETWVSITTAEIEIIIFLEEKSPISEEFLEQIFFNLNANIHSCLYLVKLRHVENAYPPQKKSFYAMKFIYTYYHERTSWLLRLDDNAYVNIPQLIRWLKSIDHRQTFYIGQGGTGRQNGPAIHFPLGYFFCMGGSGVILSQQTLMQLGPWLDQCYQSELLTKHEDVELGRCILTHVHIGCTNAFNSKVLFYHHYGPEYLFGYDFTPSIISQALILHPINDRNTFRQIFSFNQRREQQQQQQQQQQRKASFVKWRSGRGIVQVTFYNSIEFNLVRDIHYQLIDVRWKEYIHRTVQSYLEQLQRIWHQRSSNWTVVNGKVLCGYHRMVPRFGLELTVEILLTARTTSISPSQSVVLRKRLDLRQPFARKNPFDYREINNVHFNEEKSPLHLIVISSNKDEALERFLQTFQNEILHSPDLHSQFTLTILRTKAIIDQLSVKYPSIIRLLLINETTHGYNRGYGRQLASKYFTPDQLLFFLDVDVLFTRQSLINTRRMIMHQRSISSCAVYFPIIYSTFSEMFHRQENFGLFSIYGFGNVAVRKGDLDRIGGWETNNDQWGMEDGNLFTRFVNLSAKCTVFRAVEPGFRHYYHRKMCHGIANQLRQKMCTDAEANLLGSQAEMIDYIFDKNILELQVE